jgi:hypothetical protein
MATSISEFQPGKDDKEVLDLRGEVWGKDHPHTSEAFYGWLFGDSSQGPPSGILVRRDGKLVCFAGLVPRTARHQGKVVRVAHGLDFMASPGLQGLSGLYAFKLVKSWIEHATRTGYDLAVCFPNEQSIRLLTSDKLNWSVVASPRLLVLPLPAVRFDEPPSGLVPSGIATIGGRVLASALVALQPRPRSGDGVTPLDLVADALALDALWQRAGHGSCQFSRQASAMHWRYSHHPVYDYRILCRRSTTGISGFMVTTRRKVMGVESDLVVDGLWEDGDADTPRTLLAEVVARARRERTGIAGAIALPGTALYSALRRAAFLPVPAKLDPKPFHLTAYPLTPAGKDCMNTRIWHMSWGDTDVV